METSQGHSAVIMETTGGGGVLSHMSHASVHLHGKNVVV